jgi:hypothetical protein
MIGSSTTDGSATDANRQIGLNNLRKLKSLLPALHRQEAPSSLVIRHVPAHYGVGVGDTIKNPSRFFSTRSLTS